MFSCPVKGYLFKMGALDHFLSKQMKNNSMSVSPSCILLLAKPWLDLRVHLWFKAIQEKWITYNSEIWIKIR